MLDELKCFVCGAIITVQRDGVLGFRRARNQSHPEYRRCVGCRGVHLSDRDWIVSPVTRYEDDLAARIFVSMYPNGAPRALVGGVMGITQQRVAQIEEMALRKILGNRELREELRSIFAYISNMTEEYQSVFNKGKRSQ